MLLSSQILGFVDHHYERVNVIYFLDRDSYLEKVAPKIATVVGCGYALPVITRHIYICQGVILVDLGLRWLYNKYFRKKD